MVIDTSALLAVLLGEPERPALIRATRGVVLFAPAPLPWEVGNALVAMVRRNRLSRIEADRAWTGYEAVSLRLVEVDVRAAMQLAVECGLHAYDGYMLALAKARGMPLLTLDARLAAGARQAGLVIAEI
jgi:predicted nucleic acid-binding protein